MVPRLLTPEQKEIRMNICADILQNTENDPNIFENVITCVESWFSFFNKTHAVCVKSILYWKKNSCQYSNWFVTATIQLPVRERPK